MIKQIPIGQVLEEKTCKSCKHFRQHFIKLGRRYQEISYGHCVYPRLKKREADTPACNNFSERKKDITPISNTTNGGPKKQ